MEKGEEEEKRPVDVRMDLPGVSSGMPTKHPRRASGSPAYRTLPISIDALARITIQRSRRREDIALVLAATMRSHLSAQTPDDVAVADLCSLASIAVHQYLDECRLEVTPQRLENLSFELLRRAEVLLRGQ